MTRNRSDPSGPAIAAQIQRLLERDGPSCWLCHTPMDLDHPGTRLSPSRDHVIPASHGGPDTDDNMRLAHRTCNSARGDRTPTSIGPQSRRWL